MTTSDSIHNPHDRFFKSVFGDREHAKAWLPNLLPAEASAAMDWQGLQVLPCDFIGDQLEESRSDLLFSIPGTGGQLVYVYCLFEHQSSVDATMPLRLLRYIVRIWDRHLLEQRHHLLPLIIPLVLYQGSAPWTAPRSLREMLGVPDYWPWSTPWIPDFSYECIDSLNPEAQKLQKVADLKELLSFMRAVLEPESHDIRLDHALESLQRLCAVYNHPWELNELLARCLRYLLNQTRNVDKTHWRNKIMTIESPVLQEGTMNLLEQFIEEGKLEGERAILQRLLERRFRTLTPAQINRIHTADLATIDHWTTLIFDINSAQELLDAE